MNLMTADEGQKPMFSIYSHIITVIPYKILTLLKYIRIVLLRFNMNFHKKKK